MMSISEKNILRHELIGLDVEVIRDSNINNISLRGRVFDETRNTLLIKINEASKRIAKQNAVFRFKLPDGATLDVEGRALIGRPEDRVKRKIKRGW